MVYFLHFFFCIFFCNRFNKMLPQNHFDRIEKANAEQVNSATVEKSRKVVEIKENTIDKNIKSTTVADDEYDGDYDYSYDDDTEDEDIVTITPKSVSTTAKRKRLFVNSPSTLYAECVLKNYSQFARGFSRLYENSQKNNLTSTSIYKNYIKSFHFFFVYGNGFNNLTRREKKKLKNVHVMKDLKKKTFF